MNRTHSKDRKKFSITLETDLDDLLTARSKSIGIFKSDYISQLITRGLLAEDMERIREDIKDMVSTMSVPAQRDSADRLALLEILGYMRIIVAGQDPVKIDQAMNFANAMYDELWSARNE
jgi:hypothetical protein